LRTEERRFYHGRANLHAHGFDRDLHLHGVPEARLIAIQACQRNHLLEQRRSCGGGGFSHLPVAHIDRYVHARGLAWSLRRQSELVVQMLHLGPVHLESNQFLGTPRRLSSAKAERPIKFSLSRWTIFPKPSS